MEENQQTVNPLERRIDMSVAMADVERDVDARLKKMARTVRMPGFRPGKVPFRMVAQQFGPQTRSEVLGDLVGREFDRVVREQSLRVAGAPRIEPQSGGADDRFEFQAVFEVYPEVVIGDLGAVEIEKPQLETDETQVQKTVDVLREQRKEYVPVERAAVAKDMLVVDFTGRLDGTVFPGGEAKDYRMVLGEGRLLEGFETHVAGMSAGETKYFDTAFPEDYFSKELAGKTANFEVTLKSVSEPRLPEVNEDFVKSMGIADGSVDAFMGEVRKNVAREITKRIRARIKDQVMKALAEVAPIQVPTSLVDMEVTRMMDSAREDLKGRGIDPAQMPIEREWFAENAERRVRLGLIIAELVKEQDLHAKPEQVRAVVDDFSQAYEDPAEVVRWYYTQPDRIQEAEALALEDNVVNWVLERARVVEKTVSFDELMGNAA